MGYQERPRSGGFGGDRSFGPREMHKVTCSECGKETEVPFNPVEGKPVYCRDCYQKHKPQRY
jgi:CxxC-x17-CxxC domain-containing protein